MLEESRKKEEERKKQEEEEKRRAEEKAKQEEERKRQEENHRKKVEFDTLKYLPVITNHFNEILAQADGKSVRTAVGEDLLSATFMNYPLKALDGERFNVCSIFQIDKPSGRRITIFLCLDAREEQMQKPMLANSSNMLFVVSQLEGRIFDKAKERTFITVINELGKEYRRTYGCVPGYVMFLDDSYF